MRNWAFAPLICLAAANVWSASAAEPATLAADVPIAVIEDAHPGALRLWHLYDRTDATAVVGGDVALVGRVTPGEKEIVLADPPWLVVTYTNEKPGSKDGKPSNDRPKTLQVFSLQCDTAPAGLDAAGFATFSGTIRVNRPELSSHVRQQKHVPEFRIELAKVAPIACRRSLAELRSAAAADIRKVEARLKKLCSQYDLSYRFDESNLSFSWYKGNVAFTTLVSTHPQFSRKPVPYASISALYDPKSGEISRFVFTRRVWQDPPD